MNDDDDGSDLVLLVIVIVIVIVMVIVMVIVIVSRNPILNGMLPVLFYGYFGPFQFLLLQAFLYFLLFILKRV